MTESAPVRLVLAEDHSLMRAALRHVLESRDGFELVGEAATGEEVVPVVSSAAPDLVLLDLALPEPDGLTCLAELQRRFPRLPVVILSASASPELVRRSSEAGARGYLLKTIAPEVLLDVVERVAFSEPGEFLTRGLEDAPTGQAAKLLTKRELSVLSALGRGLSNKAIARELWVTEPTVKFHVRNIYAKLGITSRVEAAAYAYQEGLVEERPTGVGPGDTAIR